MLFTRIKLENVGPISNIDIEFPKNENGDPKPLVLVGANGSGKTIFIAHLIDALMRAQQIYYRNPEVEKGFLYKYGSPEYIKTGCNYYFHSVEFEQGQYVRLLQLNNTKQEFEKTNATLSADLKANNNLWGIMPPDNSCADQTSFRKEHNKIVRQIFEEQCCLYFPINRYEEPAWQNIEKLKTRANYSKHKNITGRYNREIVCTSPLTKNQDWILDVYLDSVKDIYHAFLDHGITREGKFDMNFVSQLFSPNITLDRVLASPISKIFGIEHANFIISGRHSRTVAISSSYRYDDILINNLFKLSSGETQLFNLVISILRDYDLSGGQLGDLNNVKGIVIIDEVDLNLHFSHQYKVLPELIKLFPKVQFVITTHSPLFLMSMHNVYGDDGFEIVNLPEGNKILAEQFSEFESAYQSFIETERFNNDMKERVRQLQKPTVFVEGDTDKKYILAAASLHNKGDLLNNINIEILDGVGQLNKVKKEHMQWLSKVINQKVLLLYDCEVTSPNKSEGILYKRVIPMNNENPIKKGIENLFPEETIGRAKEKDYVESIRRIIYANKSGEEDKVEETKLVKDGQKSNMCNWLCKDGTKEDFKHFDTIFSIIEEVFLSD